MPLSRLLQSVNITGGRGREGEDRAMPKGSGGVMRVTGPDGSSFATCNCGCGDKPASAACYYHGTVHCSKGGPPKSFLDTFKVTTVTNHAPAKKQGGKRKVPHSSPASNKAPVHSVASDASSCTRHDAVHFAVARLIQDDVDVDAKKATAIKSEGGGSKQAKASGKAGASQDLAVEKKKPEMKKNGASAGRGYTGYMLFCNANRQGVKEAYPRIVAKEIMVVLAAEWQNLPKEDKELWNAKGKEAREAFKKASAEGGSVEGKGPEG